jgi:hypothetical protein
MSIAGAAKGTPAIRERTGAKSGEKQTKWCAHATDSKRKRDAQHLRELCVNSSTSITYANLVISAIGKTRATSTIMIQHGARPPIKAFWIHGDPKIAIFGSNFT